ELRGDSRDQRFMPSVFRQFGVLGELSRDAESREERNEEERAGVGRAARRAPEWRGEGESGPQGQAGGGGRGWGGRGRGGGGGPPPKPEFTGDPRLFRHRSTSPAIDSFPRLFAPDVRAPSASRSDATPSARTIPSITARTTVGNIALDARDGRSPTSSIV